MGRVHDCLREWLRGKQTKLWMHEEVLWGVALGSGVYPDLRWQRSWRRFMTRHLGRIVYGAHKRLKVKPLKEPFMSYFLENFIAPL